MDTVDVYIEKYNYDTNIFYCYIVLNSIFRIILSEIRRSSVLCE